MFDSNLQLAFARKIFRLFANICQQDIENEVRALNKLCKNQYTNLVQVLDSGQVKKDGALYFIDIELRDITLDSYLYCGSISGLPDWKDIHDRGKVQAYVDSILQHIVNGLVYIHCLREVHRNLSPQTVNPNNAILILHCFFETITVFELTPEATSDYLCGKRETMLPSS